MYSVLNANLPILLRSIIRRPYIINITEIFKEEYKMFIYDLVEKLVDVIFNIFDDEKLSKDEKREKVRENVNNALWHTKLISFNKEDNED